MKKLSMVSMLFISFGLLGGASGIFVEAAENDASTPATATIEKPDENDPNDNGSEGDDSGNPTDPDDDSGFNPDNPNTGTPGLLRIDHAPSSFNFGTIKIGSKQTKFAALESGTATDGTAKEVPNYVKVTDNTGNFAGWELSVSRTEFVNQEDEAQTLDGTTLSFKHAYANAGSKGEGMPSTVASETAIPVDAKTVLVQANENEGMGEWYYVLGATNEEGAQAVALDVPVKKYTAGSYTSTLNWNLTDAPNA
ncbi:WxL domain-containing protein [Candidatus Enterococcus ferrettii]|uniref:WxL domain-containing protein n=1 Tax=Candidatus Enterococcus ferrettii TaxID=2815324 RepID=A0ABV0EL14_9ENTE|nr:WxL domain-containing protein [Enterococcus sp. 665A]MBO1342553.1 WxL domain-containing protein [Enterococcus sp. 665A]